MTRESAAILSPSRSSKDPRRQSPLPLLVESDHFALHTHYPGPYSEEQNYKQRN